MRNKKFMASRPPQKLYIFFSNLTKLRGLLKFFPTSLFQTCFDKRISFYPFSRWPHKTPPLSENEKLGPGSENI